MWCSSANELQQNSNASSWEEYVPPILTVLLEIHRVYIWPSWPFVFCLSLVNNLTSSVYNFCRWVAEIIPCETSSAAKSEEKRLFSQAMSSLNWFFWWVQICLSSCLQGLFNFFLGIATNLDNKNNNSSRTFPTFVRWPLNNLLSPCTSCLLQLFGAGENIFYSCLYTMYYYFTSLYSSYERHTDNFQMQPRLNYNFPVQNVKLI